MSKLKKKKQIRFPGKVLWVFIFSIVALICFTGTIYQQRKSQEKTRLWVSQTYRAISRIDDINTLIAESASATREFLLTKDSAWKNQLLNLHQRLDKALDAVESLADSNAAQRANISEVKRLVREKQQFQKEILTSNATAGSAFIEKTTPVGDRALIDQGLKSLINNMLDSEENLLAKRIQENENSYTNSAYTVFIGGLFSFLLIMGVLLLLSRDMHLRKKAEAALSVSEAKYRNLIENAELVMYTTDINGNITFANNQSVKLTGYSVDELIGKDFYFLLHPAWMQQVFNFYFKQFHDKTPSTVLEFMMRTKSGQQKWVEQIAQLQFDGEMILGFQCMVRDITEKKNVELELKESEAERKQNQYRLESVLDHTTSLVFIKDLEGRYIMMNKRFKQLMRLSDDVINKTDYEFNPKELADHYRALDYKVINSRQPIESEEWVDSPEGKMNLLLIKFPLLDAEKNIFGVGGIATDITDRTEYQRQLIAAKKIAEESKQMQEQFLANMSHEIRTPMNGIQGMTNLLLETKLTEEQKDFTNIIKRSVSNLLVMVDDILDFSKIKAGKLTIEKVPFSIHEVMENMKLLLSNRMDKKGLALQINIQSKIPSTLIGDPVRLGQILVNLVANAVKFTESGYVKVNVELQQKMRKSVTLEFSVSDTGIGIAPDKIDTIFESFAQADAGATRRYGGAGLGLAISKSLVQLQGGEIYVKSKPGEGSVFTFYIPYGLKLKVDKNPDGLSDLSIKNKRFLVVEDNEVNQKLISYLILKEGGLVEIAGNGREAIAHFENNRKFDLVIMDVQMPEMDGYEASAYIRQVLKSDVPIIAMTATALKGDLEKCMEAGMNDFMLKPFDFEDLYERLVRLLYKDVLNLKHKQEEPEEEIKLYDLELLESLDNKTSMLEVLTLFIDDIPAQAKEMLLMAQQQQWASLYKLAHKLKGAVAMLQAHAIADLLGQIEISTKEPKPDIDAVLMAEQVKQAYALFSQLEVQLRVEQEKIKRELGSAEKKEIFL